jgi:Pyridoxamine 5'-phosphate oxidase
MATIFEEIDEQLGQWIARQPLFFVATAPRADDGHVNLSPKGPIGTLRVLGPREVAYLDLIGSGAETIAHLRENGRIVVMLCAFEGPPRILRLHGRGEVLMQPDPAFDELLERCAFDEPEVSESRRAIVRVEVSRVADSCGYGVPLMSYGGDREHQHAWASKKLRVGGAEAFLDYQREKNSESLDGLPAVEMRAPATRTI